MVVIKRVRFWLGVFQWWIRMGKCRVVQRVPISSKTIAWSRDLLQPTQLYLPLIHNSANRMDVSTCPHSSPPFTHTALQLLHRACAFNWAFWIYSPRILIIIVLFTALCIHSHPQPRNFLSPAFWQPSRRAGWTKREGGKNVRLGWGWMQREVKRTIINEMRGE